MAEDLRLTDTQRKILETLCRPCAGESRFAPPATNQAIADELFLSVDAIKAHLRVLFRKFGIESLPHNQKRARLVELAFVRGVAGGETDGGDATPGPQDPEGPNVVAVPAARAPEGGGPARPESSIPRQERPGRLIAAGIAVAVVLIGVTAVVLAKGGDGGSRPSNAEVVREIRARCATAIEAAGPVARGGAPDAANTQSAIESVRVRISDLGTPAGDHHGLDQFSAGLDQAAALIDDVVKGTDGGPSAFADLTFAAGKIEAGAVKYGLGERGEPCYRIGARVGATDPNG